MKKTIALLYGGASKEHDVSVMGYEYVEGLLDKSKYDVLPVYIERDGKWTVRIKDRELTAYPTAHLGGSLYTVYGFIGIDAAIPLLHGDGGEDGCIEGALECCGIKYIGADVSTSALCLDKVYTKLVADSLGIPTARHVAFSRPTDTETALSLCQGRLGFPMFIKPRRLGSSIGAFAVWSEADFRKYFPIASECGKGSVMAEVLLTEKRELECAFCELRGNRTVTPPAEVLVNGFYGYGEKYGGKTMTVTEADLPSDVKSEIMSYARLLADAVSLRHLGRIDFFLTDGGVCFNEINTFPGFTRESLYPKMLIRHGIDPGDALTSFIEDAVRC